MKILYYIFITIGSLAFVIASFLWFISDPGFNDTKLTILTMFGPMSLLVPCGLLLLFIDYLKGQKKTKTPLSHKKNDLVGRPEL